MGLVSVKDSVTDVVTPSADAIAKQLCALAVKLLIPHASASVSLTLVSMACIEDTTSIPHCGVKPMPLILCEPVAVGESMAMTFAVTPLNWRARYPKVAAADTPRVVASNPEDVKF